MNSAEGLALVARVVGGLVIVLVLIAISARIARRTRHFGSGTDLEIIDRLGVSRDNQLAVVRVAGRHLLLAIGPQGIRMLSHLDDAAMAFEPGAPGSQVSPVQAPPVTQAPSIAPPITPVPATIADLPEDVAAELVAQFEAAARAEEAQAEQARAEPTRAEPTRPEPARSEEAQPPLRRPRRRHANPDPATDPAPDLTPAAEAVEVADVPGVQLPGAVNLGDYPDLASALRAAGRTTGPGSAPGSQPAEAESALPGSSSWIPSQRQSQDTDLSHATSSAPVPPVAPGAASSSDPEPGTSERRGRARRVPQQQASGSVLSPGTWKQGLEALREYTVRRG